MTLTNWDDETEYLDVELSLEDRSIHGNAALLSIPYVGTFHDTLPPAPLRDLQQAENAARGFGEAVPLLYGRQLFEWLFQGRLREGLLKGRQAAADMPGTRWRFRLRLGPDSDGHPHSLTDLRWEALYYRKEDWGLAVETAFSRVRTTTSSCSVRSLVSSRPIRLLMATTRAFAGPNDRPFEELQLHFKHEIMQTLRQLFDVKLLWPPLSFENLTEATRGMNCECLMLAAPIHGDWMEFDDGPVQVSSLVDALVSDRAPALALLVDSGGHERGTATLAGALLDRGTRAVIEIGGPTELAEVEAFVSGFFERLRKCGAIDVAAAEGRRRAMATKPDGWGWTLPRLTLESPGDYQLFQRLPDDLEANLTQLSKWKTGH